LGDEYPTPFIPSGILHGRIVCAKIPWEKWARWFLPLIGVWYALGLIFMIIAQAINYGPF
jgi:uncharacterized ion transporter superfamily protein YfcC